MEAAQELTSDQAGLIVVGEPTLEKEFDKAITRTARIVKRSVDATTDELVSALQEALKRED
jgi:molybdenum cofactor biosynthesis enzyme MoaA